jgi:hypothetical protein
VIRRDQLPEGERPRSLAPRDRPGAQVAEVTAGTEVAVPYYIDAWAPPEPETIDGAALLTDVARWFGTNIAFPSVSAQVLLTLWNVHALARDRGDKGIGPPIWHATPRLGVTSKYNKSAKSTVLDMTGMLQGTTRSRITARALAEKIGHKHQTVTLDEVKITFGTGLAATDIQWILLNGYTPRATWEYQSGSRVIEIPCFGPAAYAAKDDLITATADRLEDLFDRTIFLRMTRADRLMPQVDEQTEADALLLQESLIGWTDSVRSELRMRARDLARLDHEASAQAAAEGREIDARRPQIWRPLLAVADVAGAPWPVLARRAMHELTRGAAAAEAEARQEAIRERASHWAPFEIEGSDDDA